MPQLIAAIDVCTTGARTIIFDIEGKMLANSYQEYPIIIPKPTWVEQDARQWWKVVGATSKKVLSKKSINPSDIIAVAVTNQRETIVPVDKNGEPLHNAIVWQDRRSVKQCDEIRKIIGEKQIFDNTGLTIDPYFSGSKILWLKERKHDIFRKTYKFLLVHDYIVQKLTGEYVTDHSNASRTMLFDINKFEWSDSICEKLDISIDTLPKSNPSGMVIGEIIHQAAQVTGLKTGTPVVAGGGDQQCAALGLGVIREGLIKATTGTGTFLIAHLSKPKFDTLKRVLCSVSAIPKQWVLEASIFTTGAIYRWFRDNFAQYEKEKAQERGIDVYEILNKEIERAEPGANGLLLLPHFAGAGAPHWDPEAKGAIYGLTLGHTKRDILRAIIEGVCFEIKNSLDVFNELGLKIDELRIAGGATRAKIWNQLQADIYGIPVVKSTYEETTAVGAAILGAIGAGIYKTHQKAVENMVELKTKISPREKLKKFYKNRYLQHKKLYKKLK